MGVPEVTIQPESHGMEGNVLSGKRSVRTHRIRNWRVKGQQRYRRSNRERTGHRSPLTLPQKWWKDSVFCWHLQWSRNEVLSPYSPLLLGVCSFEMLSGRKRKYWACMNIFKIGKPQRGLPWWLSDKGSACQCRRCKRRRLDPWVGKVPCRRIWQQAPALLPGESHGHRSPAGYSLWGCKGSDTTERLKNDETENSELKPWPTQVALLEIPPHSIRGSERHTKARIRVASGAESPTYGWYFLST